MKDLYADLTNDNLDELISTTAETIRGIAFSGKPIPRHLKKQLKLMYREDRARARAVDRERQRAINDMC
ncbi:hypothetical protein [Leifsonia sp. Leaf264]|uniref:hypothetical protein n=1 Tax=Leifsonia sp. Leaf264 TaxID=1736314 RepID=UPI0006F38ABB|nr:hypothetical protein [Leifsonia sp. Leaf264]KQO98414.1 hypothetical protein ASF30_10155 [Leifsonia sp. Leaf264]